MTPSKNTDHALAIFKATLNALPVVGGPIASLIGDYVPTSRQQALEKGARLFMERVQAIESRIKNDAIDKEGFADLFGKFSALAAKTNREEKLRAAANILANALLPADDPNKSVYEELEHLMHCADALSSGAIVVLGASIQVEPLGHNARQSRQFYMPQLVRKLPSYDPNLIIALATELRSLNMLQVNDSTIDGSHFENALIRVTPSGWRFAGRFIEGRM